MAIAKKTILVPWDFTEVAENALLHAIGLAKTVAAEIKLINIAKSKKELEEASAKLSERAAEASKLNSLEITALVREGNIFSTIKEVAEEENALFVVMGTHGIKGMQKLTGSWALKVIAKSKVPFIVVQGPPEHSDYKKIVFPVDFSVENKEKLRWADLVARYFDSKMYLFIPYITDENLLKKTRANLTYARKYLDERQINYEITASQTKGKFSDQVGSFATEVDADLVMIMTTKDPGVADYIFGADEQQIIANSAKIPVMCVNPRELGKLQGFHG